MPAGTPSRPAPSRGVGLLGRRDVRLLLVGQAASELGSQVGSIALPLVAVLTLGASPFQVGVLAAAGTISFAVLAQPALRAITACTALTNLLWAAAGTVQLLFLVHEVGLAPAAIGLLVSAGAAGGLLAALAATRVARGADTARLIWLPLTLTAPFALCTPLTAPGWRVALFPLGVAVTSFGQVLYNIAQISFRQALCPPELLGRMNASIRFLVFGALPLGGLLGGLAGERLGVHPTLWLVGIGLTLTPLPLLASPLRRPASEVRRGRRQ
jgi:hypothetical protein